ncbi:Uu.00g050710.m01.CDS01 [Anthostomella pinea]|uniref:Uu.00g050710.m01.CDS01 n=1 Tax=Anthostomella pinea TaxID=933095 RepID=A0AAI8YMJ4_9PEZI|nr:Uu.00g050710.m01.CDS01 [Anthostomella pinea]
MAILIISALLGAAAAASNWQPGQYFNCQKSTSLSADRLSAAQASAHDSEIFICTTVNPSEIILSVAGTSTGQSAATSVGEPKAVYVMVHTMLPTLAWDHELFLTDDPTATINGSRVGNAVMMNE